MITARAQKSPYKALLVKKVHLKVTKKKLMVADLGIGDVGDQNRPTFKGVIDLESKLDGWSLPSVHVVIRVDSTVIIRSSIALTKKKDGIERFSTDFRTLTKD